MLERRETRKHPLAAVGLGIIALATAAALSAEEPLPPDSPPAAEEEKVDAGVPPPSEGSELDDALLPGDEGGDPALLPANQDEQPPSGALFDDEVADRFSPEDYTHVGDSPWAGIAGGAGVGSPDERTIGSGAISENTQRPFDFSASVSLGIRTESTSRGSAAGASIAGASTTADASTTTGASTAREATPPQDERSDPNDGLRTTAGLDLSVAKIQSGTGLSYDASYGGGVTALEGMWDDLRYDHRFAGGIGHQGAFTTTALRGDYSRSDGDTGGTEPLDREIRLSENTRWSINGSIVRALSRGSLEFSAGTSTTESGDSSEDAADTADAAAGAPDGGAPAAVALDGVVPGVGSGGLNDSTSRYVDLVWYYMPPRSAKTSFGLGMNVGNSETESSPDQSWWEPSLRWRYALREKVQTNAQVGYHVRSVDGVPGDAGAWTYSGEVTWTPTDGTALSLNAYREVAPSLISISEDTIDTGFGFGFSKRLPRSFTLSANLGIENSEFVAVESPETSGGREDDFYVFGVNLSRSFQLERTVMTASLFYDYSKNVSNLGNNDYERHSAGVNIRLTR